MDILKVSSIHYSVYRGIIRTVGHKWLGKIKKLTIFKVKVKSKNARFLFSSQVHTFHE